MTMDIRINRAACNQTAIQTALMIIQSRARVRTITLGDMWTCLDDFKRETGLSARALEGTRVDVDLHAQVMSKAYKGIPQSTQFSARFERGVWHITDIRRDVLKQHSWHVEATYSECAKEALVQRMSRMR